MISPLSAQDEDLAMIAAQQYFIEYKLNIDANRLQELLPSYIPDSYLPKQNAGQHWMQAIISKLRSPYFQNPRIEPLKVGTFVSFNFF